MSRYGYAIELCNLAIGFGVANRVERQNQQAAA